MTNEAMIKATVARLRWDLNELIRFVPQEKWPTELAEIRRLILEIQLRDK